MAASIWYVHNSAIEEMSDNTIDLDDDVFECRLYGAGSNVGSLTLSDATTATQGLDGESPNNGYAHQTLTQTWVESGGTVTFDGDNPAFTAAGGTLTAAFAAIVDTTTTPDKVLAHCELNTGTSPVGTVAVTTGNTLTVQMNASGIFTVARA